MKVKKFSFQKFYDFSINTKKQIPNKLFIEMKQYDGKEVKYDKLQLADGDTLYVIDAWLDIVDLTPVSNIKIMNSFIKEEFGINFDTEEELSEFLILCENENLYWNIGDLKKKKATEYVPKYEGTQTFIQHLIGENGFSDTLTVGDSSEEYFEEYPIKLMKYKDFINIYKEEAICKA